MSTSRISISGFGTLILVSVDTEPMMMVTVSSVCNHQIMFIAIGQLYGVWLFQANTNKYVVSSNYFYLIVITCLHTAIWFQATKNNLQ